MAFRTAATWSLLAALLLLSWSERLTAADPSEQVRSDILVLGRVTNNPRKIYLRTKVLADYIAGGLRAQGITEAQVQFAADNEQMAAMLRSGLVDLVPESIFSALILVEQANAKLLLREWRDGVPAYRSLIFVRDDSGIRELNDLRGRTIAFEDPGSTSSFFVPRAMLLDAGLKLIEMAEPGQEPPVDSVGYVFAGSENTIAAWVHQGMVDAGTFNDVDWAQENDLPAAIKRELRVIHESDPLPRAVMLVRGDLPPALEDGIRRVLLAAADDPEGAQALKEYKGVSRYDAIEGEVAAGVAAARQILAASP